MNDEFIHNFDPLAWAAQNDNERQADKSDEPQAAAASARTMKSGVGQHYADSDTQRQPTDNDHLRTMDDLAEEVVRRGLNLTEDYNDWIKMGFAIADEKGEQGRQLFHQVSSTSSKYDPATCDKKFTELLRPGCYSGQRVHANTFYKMVKDAGVDICVRNQVCAKSANVPCANNKENNNISTKMDISGNDVPVGIMAQLAQKSELSSCLTFTDKLKKEDIPSILMPVLESQSDAVSRDKMFLGVMNIFSGMLPSTLYSIYDRRKVYPPLYNIIYGGFATSKGELEACRRIAQPVKQEMRRQYEAEKADYDEQMAQWNSQNKRERGLPPKEPVYRSPMVPANSSASAVYRGMEANGGWGLMFETEADTLTNMLSKSEYGDYSDLLRKAHHHETIEMVRVTDHLNIEIEEPRLSVFLTCTGSQLPQLLPPDNVANGLASRFLFYALPSNKVVFRDVFAHQEQPLDDIYLKLGERFLPLYHELLQRKDKPIQFVMSKAQQTEFVSTFNGVLCEEYGLMGEGIQGFIYRLALECYRYAMVLSVLRRLSEWNQLDDIFEPDEVALPCDDRDFHSAMTIINCLVNHTTRVYAVLAAKDTDPFSNATEQPNPKQREFYRALPTGEFKTAEALAIADRLNISRRSAQRALGEFVSRFQVLGRPLQGTYVKPDRQADVPADDGLEP